MAQTIKLPQKPINLEKRTFVSNTRILQRIFFFIILLIIQLAKAQDDRRYLDSMQLAINSTKDEYKKARAIMKLADFWSYRDTAKAFAVLAEADPYIKNKPELQGLKLIYKAGIYYDKDIEKSQKLYMEAEEILKHIDSKMVYDDRTMLWHGYSALEKLKGNWNESMRIKIEKCIPLAKKSGRKSLIVLQYVDVGQVMNDIKNYHKAIQYLETAVNEFNQINDQTENTIWALLNLSVSYTATNQLEKAKKTLDHIAELQKKLPKTQDIPLYYQHLANYYTKSKKPELALEAIEKGIKEAKILNIPYDIQSLNFEKFKVLEAEKQYTRAEAVLLELLENNKYDNGENKAIFVEAMANLQEKMGNFEKAYYYLSEHQKLKTIANNATNQKNIRELEAKYNTSQKERQLLELENRSRMQRIVLILSLVIAAALISFFLYAMNQRKKRNRNEIIRIEQERKLDFSKALLEGEEQERKRIARELHDGLGGRITGVKLSLENSELRDKDTVKNNIRQLEEILNEVRQTARNLMPESIQKSGLQAAIQDYCCEMSSGDVQICFYSDPLDQIVERKDQINIYRIVQELITNGIRHGEASKILLNIAMQHPMLLIDYEDDGKGFDTMQQKRNLGMNNIENRALNMRGTAHWVSEPGEGTSVNIHLYI